MSGADVEQHAMNTEPDTPNDLKQLRARHLMETEELEARMGNDANLRIVDMRGFVHVQTDADGKQTADYVGAAEVYAASHIPGAIYLDWTRDIVDLNDPVAAQLASPEKITQVLGDKGIGDDSLIVAYDAHPAMQFATRFWWVMRVYGNKNVRVLNGGWGKWTRENRLITSDMPHFLPAIFTPNLQPPWIADAERVRDWIGNPDVVLLDARDEGQFTGKIVRGKRGGHIPGARNVPREALIAPDGTFQPAPELLKTLHNAGAAPNRRNVAYCNGGVAATSILFALSMLDYPRLTNYDGSWNEWTEREDLPVEK